MKAPQTSWVGRIAYAPALEMQEKAVAARAAAGQPVRAQHLQDGQHRHVGFPRARGRAKEHVLGRVQRGGRQLGLHAVELGHARKGGLRPGG